MHPTASPITIDLTHPRLATPALGLADGARAVVSTPELSREYAEHQVQVMQRQMDALRSELNDLRRRDETLNFYMHRLNEELMLAARLQQDFLPKELAPIGRLQFHSLFRPCGYVSGDLYDVMRLDERHVGFYMADAVGHGVPAALMAMFLKHALETKELAGPDGYRLLDPTETLRRLNVKMMEQNLSNSTFATALYGTIDTETLELRVARAGHPTPILMRADGRVEELDCQGCLLGVFGEETFDGHTTTLAPGDRLLVYTDGVEVAFWDDQHSQEPTHQHRWRGELLARRDMAAEQLLAEFAAHLDHEAGSLQARDDLTMLLIDVDR